MAMAPKDDLITLLRDRFADHGCPAPAGAWDAIASQLALGAATGADLGDVLRDRFTGHEAEVDPGVWEAIEHRVAQADPVNSLLRDRFAGHELPAPSAAWTAIEGQLGHGTAAGGGSLLGWVAGGAATLLVAGGLYLVTDGRVEGTERAVAPAVSAPAPTIQRTPAPRAPNPVAEVVAPAAGRSTPGAPLVVPPMEVPAAGTAVRDEEPRVAELPAAPAVPAPPTLAPSTQPNTAQARGVEVVEQVLRELGTTAAAMQEDAAEDVEEPAVDEVVVAPRLYIPNVFTPNGDGENELWVPQGGDYQRVAVRIFSSATGSLVFSANDLRPWDGNDLQGQPCPTGTYIYAIEVEDLTGRTKALSNTVNIIR